MLISPLLLFVIGVTIGIILVVVYRYLTSSKENMKLDDNTWNTFSEYVKDRSDKSEEEMIAWLNEQEKQETLPPLTEKDKQDLVNSDWNAISKKIDMQIEQANT